jgi:hypothetical protein
MKYSIQCNKFGYKMSFYCLKQKVCHGMYIGSPDLYKQNKTVKTKTIKLVGRQKQADRQQSKKVVAEGRLALSDEPKRLT